MQRLDFAIVNQFGRPGGETNASRWHLGRLEEVGHAMRKTRGKTPAFIEEIVEIGVPTLVSHLGLSPACAGVAMREVAHAICQRFGGEDLYVPRDRDWLLQKRDFAIANEYAAGVPSTDLGRKYEISTRQVQVIVRHVNKHVRLVHNAADAPAKPPSGRSSQPADFTPGLGLLDLWGGLRSSPVVTSEEAGVLSGLKVQAIPDEKRTEVDE